MQWPTWSTKELVGQILWYAVRLVRVSSVNNHSDSEIHVLASCDSAVFLYLHTANYRERGTPVVGA